MSVDVVGPTVVENAAMSEAERVARVARAWQYYLGQQADVLAMSEDGVNDNVRINFSRTIVVKGVSWLFGADRALGFTVPEDETAGSSAADPQADPQDPQGPTLQQEFDDDVWPLEARALELHKLGVNGGIAGHAFAKLREDGRTVVWDPQQVDVTWDEDDVEHVTEFRYTWSSIDKATGDAEARRQRVTEDTPDRWIVFDERSTESGETWEIIKETAWGSAWCPVHHCQNLPIPNEFWGESDLEPDILDLIDAIVAVAGYCRKIIRHRGHPVPWVTGEEAKKIASLNLALGRLLAIPDASAKVGQLQAADLGGALELYEMLMQAFHFETRMPPLAFGIFDSSNVAEDTVELAFAPAVEKTWDKRLTYGPMITALAEHKMELASKGKRRPRPNWTSPVPRSARSEAASLEADQRMGIVSKETLAEKRGYDWDVEGERVREEAAAALEANARAFNAGNTGDPNDGQ